jgi:Flp pilus assembly CpaE family ATPase
MSALRAVRGLLDYFEEAGSINGKSTFVLNNTFAREFLKASDVETALGTRITADLPYDNFLYLKAVNEGVPIVLGAPRSPAAEQLVKLSTTAFGSDGFIVPVQTTEKKPRRFGFGRRN